MRTAIIFNGDIRQNNKKNVSLAVQFLVGHRRAQESIGARHQIDLTLFSIDICHFMRKQTGGIRYRKCVKERFLHACIYLLNHFGKGFSFRIFKSNTSMVNFLQNLSPVFTLKLVSFQSLFFHSHFLYLFFNYMVTKGLIT